MILCPDNVVKIVMESVVEKFKVTLNLCVTFTCTFTSLPQVVYTKMPFSI